MILAWGLLSAKPFARFTATTPSVRCRESARYAVATRDRQYTGHFSLNEKLPCTVHTASQRALVGSWSHTMCKCECECVAV